MAVHLRAMGVLPVGSAWNEVADTTGTPVARDRSLVPGDLVASSTRAHDAPNGHCARSLQMAGWELAPHFALVVDR